MRRPTALVMSIMIMIAASATLLDVASGAAPGPMSTSPPRVTGHANFNDTVSCDVGSWSGGSLTYTVAWYVFSSEPSGTGPAFKIDNVSYLGYGITCQVTATDASGATGSARSAAVTIKPGRTSMKIDSVKSGTRGRFVVKGHILPLIASSKYGDGADVVIQRKTGRNAVTQLSRIATVGRNGRFTVAGVDSAGRKTIKVLYSPGHGGAGVWAPAQAHRKITVSKGGRPGGGTVGIG